MKLPECHQIVSKELMTILTAAAKEINNHEVTARACLYENNDRQGYHDQLRQKAIVLSELAKKVELCEDLPPRVKTLAQEKVGSFSFEADRALRLDSVFYMAVLLYPEEYQEGSPNELEDFIIHLRQQ